MDIRSRLQSGTKIIPGTSTTEETPRASKATAALGAPVGTVPSPSKVEQLGREATRNDTTQTGSALNNFEGQPDNTNVGIDDLGRAKDLLLTSTPGVNDQLTGNAGKLDMELGQDDEPSNVDDVNLSINNVSTTSSDAVPDYHDISTDGVFDLKKIQSWSLPSIQRRTAELHRKVNAAKRRSSQLNCGRVNKQNSSTLSLPSSEKCNEFLQGTAGKTGITYRNRSFINSNLKKGLLEDMGFSTESAYIQNITEHSHVNDRRNSKLK